MLNYHRPSNVIQRPAHSVLFSIEQAEANASENLKRNPPVYSTFSFHFCVLISILCANTNKTDVCDLKSRAGCHLILHSMVCIFLCTSVY